MIAREIEERDWDLVPEFRKQYNFDWKFPEYARIEAGCVIEGHGPIALCAAELVPAVSLAMGQNLHPLVRLRAGVLIHDYLQNALKDYPVWTCEVPPELEGAYARHLQRHFGWQAMWKGLKLT